MPAFEVTTYDPKTCPLHEFSDLEDVFKRGYTIDNEKNKLEHISIRCQPLLLPHAQENVLMQENRNSISHVQRVAIIFAVSLLENDPLVKDIIRLSKNISNYCTNKETLCAHSTTNKLNFLSSSCNAEGSISMLAWCEEWIKSSSRRLGLGRTQLATYLLIYGISKYDIQNRTVREDIKLEADHFMKFLKDRHEALSRIS